MSVILGLNAYHADSSACIVVDGELVACAEEERFRRVKHWAGFPAESIRYCLSEAGVRLEQVTDLAVNSDDRANAVRKLIYVLTHRPNLSLLLRKLRARRLRAGVRDMLARSFPEDVFVGRIVPVEHHLAHLASTYYAGPFNQAVAVSVDGFGDFASAACAYAADGKINQISQVRFPHSMGVFYQAMTQYLGFHAYGDEYKVMGLASYGEPAYTREMSEIVRLVDDGKYELNLEYFRHGRDVIDYSWGDGVPVFGTLYTDALEEILGPARKVHEELDQRHKNIARSTQWMYEQALFHLLNYVHGICQCDNLVLAGGCAMNSVANGRIRNHAPFKRIYVQSAAGDAGGAVGAAFFAAARDNEGGIKLGQMPHAAWGPGYSSDEIADALSSKEDVLKGAACSVSKAHSDNHLCTTVAQAISDGLIVGWFQGRMEWGPRALGHRSILGDPRRADMKDILNSRIKRREPFRPFAPSILRHKVLEWFEHDDDTPFMMKVLEIRESKRKEIPAVTHVDGTGRLHTVTIEANPLFFKLIEAFYSLTGIPIVLNTSFNESEPIVCRPEEALDCFLRTDMDLLALESYLIRRVRIDSRTQQGSSPVGDCSEIATLVE